MEYDVIIIGAGMGGLACALRLSCAGKKILLIEKQPVPGGFATSFIRKGFVFESSVHCVDNLGPEGEIRKFLQESGVAQKVDFIELKDFCRIIYPEHDFIADFTPENFIKYLKDSFPEEIKGIDRLFNVLERLYRQFDSFSSSKLPFWLKLIISPFVYPDIIKISGLTAEAFIARFIKDIKLKAILTDIWRFTGLPPSRLSALYFLLVFKGYYYNSTSYVKGGFAQLFEAMVERIKEQGGEAKFNTAVKQIITEGKGLRSVITDKQEEFKAKVIISNANPLDTLTKLLDNGLIKARYSKRLLPLEKSISAFQVYLGLKAPAKDLGMGNFMLSINTTYNHDDSYNYCISGDYDRCSFALVDHAQIDPGLAPQGKGSLLIMTLDSYSNWSNLKEEEYEKKKIEEANRLISRANKYLPGLSESIEVIEIATPRTMAKFGSSPEGAIYGFAQNVNQSVLNRLAQETEIKGLFLTGAWTRPGAGIHGCLVSGIDAADLALRFLK